LGLPESDVSISPLKSGAPQSATVFFSKLVNLFVQRMLTMAETCRWLHWPVFAFARSALFVYRVQASLPHLSSRPFWIIMTAVSLSAERLIEDGDSEYYGFFAIQFARLPRVHSLTSICENDMLIL
jgi:hypothetical protein